MVCLHRAWEQILAYSLESHWIAHVSMRLRHFGGTSSDVARSAVVGQRLRCLRHILRLDEQFQGREEHGLAFSLRNTALPHVQNEHIEQKSRCFLWQIRPPVVLLGMLWWLLSLSAVRQLLFLHVQKAASESSFQRFMPSQSSLQVQIFVFGKAHLLPHPPHRPPPWGEVCIW